MDVEKLTKIRDLLLRNAADLKGMKFDLSAWVKPNDKAFYDVRLTVEGLIEDKIPISCDTTGCAVGLVLLSGVFEQDGLRMSAVKHTLGYDIFPEYRGYKGFRAVAALLDVGMSTARWLFDNKEYRRDLWRGRVGELAVARRIDWLIEHGEQRWSEFNYVEEMEWALPHIEEMRREAELSPA